MQRGMERHGREVCQVHKKSLTFGAEAFFREIPEDIERKGLSYLDNDLVEVVERFCDRYVGTGDCKIP